MIKNTLRRNNPFWAFFNISAVLNPFDKLFKLEIAALSIKIRHDKRCVNANIV